MPIAVRLQIEVYLEYINSINRKVVSLCPNKTRRASSELLILKSLNTRMHLSEKDKQHYLNLQKGYEGEKLFEDALTEKLQCECYILNDLLLKYNETFFQVDTLIIMEKSLYLYEVKNYEGDFYYEGERFYKLPQTELNNPLIQLKRNESLLRRLLHNLGFPLEIHSFVVFIHPTFTLYQSPLNKPFIFPTQINRHINSINKGNLNATHKQLADKLTSMHVQDFPYKQLPSYHYEQLKKGIICHNCTSFSVNVSGWKCRCSKCGQEEVVANAIMRSVEEFKLLFPDRKITTNVIYDWCKVIPSKQRIRKILEKNLKKVGVHQWTYYE